MLPTGQGGGASHQRGKAFPRPQGGCMVFAAKGGIKNGARKGAHLASAAILYNSRGRKPSTRPGGVSRSRTEPLAPRAKGPAAPSTLTPIRACQPSGIQLPAGGKRIAAGRQPFPSQRLRPSSHRALPRGGLLRCHRSRGWIPPGGCLCPGCRRHRLCPWVLLFLCIFGFLRLQAAGI